MWKITYAFVSMVFVCQAGVAGAAGIGTCKFDLPALAFVGSPTEQAKCLLRPVKQWGKLGPALSNLPAWLAAHAGSAVDIRPETLRSHLNKRLISETSLGGPLDSPVSRANSGSHSSPARYFVIHDTSSPWLGDKLFPSDIDYSQAINSLKHYAKPDAVAHMFVNRSGETLVGHDLSVPWRATKLEIKGIGTASKGLFLHIELVQPRRRDPNGGPRNDALAPIPGFSEAQYKTLALLYVASSIRAGHWLVPAFHASLDEGFPDAHDDPQHFDLEHFDRSLDELAKSVSAGQ